jgi:hypothetical protein
MASLGVGLRSQSSAVYLRDLISLSILGQPIQTVKPGLPSSPEGGEFPGALSESFVSLRRLKH